MLTAPKRSQAARLQPSRLKSWRRSPKQSAGVYVRRSMFMADASSQDIRMDEEGRTYRAKLSVRTSVVGA
jgi:hypothetical protein